MNSSLIEIARSLHIPLLMVSYIGFAVAFAVGIVYLWQERQMKSKHPHAWAFRLPSLEGLDQWIAKVIVFSLPFLTTGIFMGAIWAHQAWGRFWGWDPKETWALITWGVYIVYLAARYGVGWRGRKTAYLSLAGFAVVMFTYVGVSYFSPLHGFPLGAQH